MHEETTTKIEVTGGHRLSESKVVHVDFAKDTPKAAQTERSAPQPTGSTLFPTWTEIKTDVPWPVRIIAVVLVILLSMFVF